MKNSEFESEEEVPSPQNMVGQSRHGDGLSELVAGMTARAPRVTPARMLEMIRQAQSGDEAMLNYLVEMNAALVLSTLNKKTNLIGQKGMHLQRADFAQEGFIGLREAILRYDPAAAAFSNYATLWILRQVRFALRQVEREVRFPEHVHVLLPKIYAEEDRLAHSLGRTPTKKEIAVSMMLTEQTVGNTIGFDRTHHKAENSLSDTGEDAPPCLMESQADHNAICPALNASNSSHLDQLCQTINKSLQCLTTREKEILERRFGMSKHEIQMPAEIALAMNLPVGKVRQLLKAAKTKLKNNWPTEMEK